MSEIKIKSAKDVELSRAANQKQVARAGDNKIKNETFPASANMEVAALGKDNFTVSARAAEVTKLVGRIAQLPDDFSVDTLVTQNARLAALRDNIARGSYRPEASRIAAAMLQSL